MKTKLQTQNKEEYKETELGLLPKDWDVVKIQDLVEFERGTEPGSGNYNDKGEGIRFLRVSDVSGHRTEFIYTTSKKIKLCLPNNVLITFDGSPGIVKRGFNGAYSSGIRKVKMIKNNSDLNYLYYILQTNYVQDVIKKYSTGVTIKHASKSIPHIIIPLPPLPEQQKIAYVLSTVQNTKEKTERLINSLKELKKSTMKHLFTYGAVSFEDIDRVKLKDTEIGKVPKDWDIVKFGNVCERLIGGGTPSTNKPQYWGGNIDWTTSKRLDENKIFILDGEKKITSEGLKNSSTNLIPKDNIIISTRVTVGKVAINKIDLAISQDLTGAIIDPKKYVLEFLAYQLSTEKIQRIFQSKKRGATIKGITREDLKVFDILLPPFAEQQQIASILSSIDKKIEAEEQKKGALEQLFKSLLHNLMSGKIRVKDLIMEGVGK